MEASAALKRAGVHVLLSSWKVLFFSNGGPSAALVPCLFNDEG